jgi:hypothetical protein
VIRLGRAGWKASDYIKAVGCGLPSRLYRERHLVAVRAFADDSGSGGDSRFFVLGGFMADLPTWEKFSDDWDEALRTTPAIDYFKMSEAESLKKQFDRSKGWTEQSRDKKIDVLIDIINAYDLFQGSCEVSVEDYDATVGAAIGGKRFKGVYEDPYVYLFIGVVALFSSMEHRWEHAMRGVASDALVIFGDGIHTGDDPQPVDFVFDEGKRLTDRSARTHYEESLKPLDVFRGKLGSVDFRNDNEFMPLQAADLSAWQRRRRLCSQEPTRRHYERLHSRPARHRHTTLTREDMHATLDAIARGLSRQSAS